MRVFAGTPGTATGLFLRIAQCIFAAGSIASMASTHSFFNFTAFWYFSFAFALHFYGQCSFIRLVLGFS